MTVVTVMSTANTTVGFLCAGRCAETLHMLSNPLCVSVGRALWCVRITDEETEA